MNPPDENLNQYSTVGKNYCCAWRHGPNEIVVQFKDTSLCRKFLKGKFNCSRWSVGVAGGYLRTYIVKGKRLAWFLRWLNRNDQPQKVSKGYGGKIAGLPRKAA